MLGAPGSARPRRRLEPFFPFFAGAVDPDVPALFAARLPVARQRLIERAQEWLAESDLVRKLLPTVLSSGGRPRTAERS
jgi:hypothetical protein